MRCLLCTLLLLAAGPALSADAYPSKAVRMLVPTPDKSLRPESFVKVVIHVSMGVTLAVPRNAVLETGTSRIVFVVENEGTFEPRAVTLGRGAPDYYEVLAGLAEGDEVEKFGHSILRSARVETDGPG